MTRRWILALQAVLVVSVASADEGRIPIFRPTTITQPGTYYLTRPIDSSGVNQTGILIQASNVTLDLSGRTIFSNSGGDTGILIADGVRDVTIRNGVFSGPSGFGVSYFSTTVGTRITIESLVMHGPGGGIYITGAEYVDIRSCRIYSPSGAGIAVGGISTGATFGGRIAQNTVITSGLDGISIGSMRAGEIRGNVVTQTGHAFGIYVSGIATGAGGNVIAENMVTGTASALGGIGIGLSHNLVVNNTVKGFGTDGLSITANVTSGNLVLDNVIGINGGNGIFASAASHSLIEGNVSQGNNGCGIGFSVVGENAYRNNMLRNNTGGAVCNSGAGNTDAGGNIL